MTRRRILIATAIALLVAAFAWWTPSPDLAMRAIRWVEDAGPVGHAAFAVHYAISSVLGFPASWNTAAAGFLYGPIGGLVIGGLYNTAAAALTFVLGRSILRGIVERRAAESPRMAKLDRAVARSGFRTVLLVRLPPISPFNIVSHLFAASGVGLRAFVIGTFVGHLPHLLLFSQIGASVSDVTEILEGGDGPDGLRLFALLVTLLVCIPLTAMARNALREDGEDAPEQG